jgi:hypothetical protein
VGTYPKAIFALAGGLLGIIILLLAGFTARPEGISLSDVEEDYQSDEDDSA